MPISFVSFDWVVSPPGDQPQVSSLMSTLTFGLTSWIYLWLQSMSNINWSAPYLRIWSWKWPRRRFHRCWRKWRPPCRAKVAVWCAVNVSLLQKGKVRNRTLIQSKSMLVEQEYVMDILSAHLRSSPWTVNWSWNCNQTNSSVVRFS